MSYDPEDFHSRGMETPDKMQPVCFQCGCKSPLQIAGSDKFICGRCAHGNIRKAANEWRALHGLAPVIHCP